MRTKGKDATDLAPTGDIGDVPCYWINRQQDDFRRSAMTAWLTSSNLRHFRVDAFTPETVPHVKIQPHHLGVTTALEIACACSHLRAVKQAYDDGHSFALILEDDVRSLYRYDLNQLIDLAPGDWDVLQLHTSNARVVYGLGETYRKFHILWQEWETDHHSAGAYLINRHGMEKLIAAHLPSAGGKEWVDFSMILAITRVTAEYVLFKRTASYSMTIPLFLHDLAMTSVIHPGHRMLHESGLMAINCVMSSVQDEMSLVGTDDGYPFALEKIEA